MHEAHDATPRFGHCLCKKRPNKHGELIVLIGGSLTEINPQTTARFTNPSFADPIDGTRNDPEVFLKLVSPPYTGNLPIAM